MTTPLLKNLLQFYEEDPHDPFNSYALALEYSKTDLSKAETLFRKLLAEHPEYLPTYYHAARLFADLGKSEEASGAYETGISLAHRQGNTKIQQELTGAYRQFKEEEEED